jgi:toxin-antitoxin system PIN domain toxin
VIAVDTNLLVFAHRDDSPFHEAAWRSLTLLAESRAPWAIPWPCIHEFFSIATHPRIYNPPTPIPKALDQIEAWMESPSLVLLNESPAHWASLKPLLLTGRIAGPLVHDARIAALCQQHAVRELWTADRDFGRFPCLRTHNPLVAS